MNEIEAVKAENNGNLRMIIKTAESALAMSDRNQELETIRMFANSLQKEEVK